MDDWRTAARFGVPFGMVVAVVGGGVVLVRTIDPSPQLRIVPYLWLLIAVICAFLAGMFAARSSGSLSAGIRAGAMACALAATIVFAIFVYVPAYQRQQADPKSQMFSPLVNAVLIGLILLVFAVVGGGLFGGLASIPGALLGRAQAQSERLNTPTLPEYAHSQHELPGALDEMALVAAASSEDITIPPNWFKSLLMFLLTLSFVAIGFAIVSSGDNAVLGWICVVLFGLLVFLAPINMAINRPLLRFSADGIAYKGAYSFWRRGFAPWDDVGAIVFSKAPNSLFGRYELNVFIEGQRPWRGKFQNWQLPFSARKSLRLAILRYHKQIEENEIVIRGIE